MSQFVCTRCGVVNRTPAGRDATAARCGRCGRRLFDGHPAEVTKAQLEAHSRSTKGAALLLDVWAPWCGPCRAMAPQLEAAASRLEPHVRLLKLNSDDYPDTAAELGVSGIPALFLIEDGRVIARHAGLMSAQQIVAFARQSQAAGGV